MSRGESVLEFTFESLYDAEQALNSANEKWKQEYIEETGQPVLVEGQIEIEPREPFTPKGQILRINLNDGMQEPDENGAFWMITDETGEYMVSRVTEEWHCVA